MSKSYGLAKWIAGAAVVAIVCTLLWYFSSTVVYILISAVLAIIGRPVVRALSNIKVGRYAVPRFVAAFITLMLMWVVLVGFCLLVVPLVVGKVASLESLDLHAVLANIQQPLEHIQSYFSSFGLMSQHSVSVSEILVGWLRKVLNYDTINTAFSSVVDITLTMVVAFFSVSFITFFFLKEDGLFFRMVTALFPERYAENVTRALDKITLLLSRYFTGLLFESVILMVVISVVLILFGFAAENACFIGVIMGTMNVIPYAGPLMGGIASMFVGVVSPIEGCTIGYTLAVIVGTLLTVKGLDDFVIQPTLYSERVNAHPLEVFIVILLAGSAGGIVGMLLAIPSYTVLRVFAKEFFSQYALVKKLTKDI
ncbi:MAG: AI-2E family transporter [Alistipes sp.]|nr:AI-2E family transporter [Alistipes sp.]